MNFRPSFLDRLFAKTAPVDPWIVHFDARLAARKALRRHRSEAAKLGWKTRRGGAA